MSQEEPGKLNEALGIISGTSEQIGALKAKQEIIKYLYLYGFGEAALIVAAMTMRELLDSHEGEPAEPKHAKVEVDEGFGL